MIVASLNAETKRPVEDIKVLGGLRISTTESLEHVDRGNLVCGIEEQQVIHILGRQVAHVLPLVRIADL